MLKLILKDIGILILLSVALSLVCIPVLAVAGLPRVGGKTAVFTLRDGSRIHAASEDEIRKIQQREEGNIRSLVIDAPAPLEKRAWVAVFIGFSAALLVYVAFRERAKLAAWLRPTPIAVGLGATGGIALLLLSAVNTYLLHAVGLEPPDVASVLNGMIPLPLLLMVGAFFAPVGEELYFRGRLYDVIRGDVGPGAAAAITSLLFGLAHGIPVLLPILVAFGLLFVLLRNLSGGLLAPIIAHLTNNLLGLLFAYFAHDLGV